MQLEFEWDPVKDAANERKHDISFAEATTVFDDPQLVEEDVTRPEHGERRYKAIGRMGQFIGAVIYTDRHQHRRIISARRAHRSERERYRQSAETV